MGNSATILIRTDGLRAIRSNTIEFVDRLHDTMELVEITGKPLDFKTGNHGNPAQVISVHHNDTTAILAVGGGRGIELATVYRWSWPADREMAKDVVRELIHEYKLTSQDRLGI